MEHTYPYVDLSIMVEQYKCAIRVSSKEEAMALIYNAKQQFPNRTQTWECDETYWRNRDSKGLCYTMFRQGDNIPTSMSYTGALWFEENGYEITDFADLMCPQVEIEESEMSLDVLLSQDSASIQS